MVKRIRHSCVVGSSWSWPVLGVQLHDDWQPGFSDYDLMEYIQPMVMVPLLVVEPVGLPLHPQAGADCKIPEAFTFFSGTVP